MSKMKVSEYRVIFENEMRTTVMAKNNNSAFRKAKKKLIKMHDYDLDLMDELAGYGYQNARVILL